MVKICGKNRVKLVIQVENYAVFFATFPALTAETLGACARASAPEREGGHLDLA
jgi:hypothetical protein